MHWALVCLPPAVPAYAVFGSHKALGARHVHVRASTIGVTPWRPIAHNLWWCLVSPRWSVATVATSATAATTIVKPTAFPLHGGRYHLVRVTGCNGRHDLGVAVATIAAVARLRLRTTA